MDNMTINSFGRKRGKTAGILWITQKMWITSPNKDFPRSVIHREKQAAEGWMMWMMLITLAGKEVSADFIYISGSHGYHQIPFSAICQKVFFDF